MILKVINKHCKNLRTQLDKKREAEEEMFATLLLQVTKDVVEYVNTCG